jgi:hypothetical protein
MSDKLTDERLREIADSPWLMLNPAPIAEELLRLRSEIERLRAERRQLRRRLIECRPWVGACPYPNTPGFDEVMAIRGLADDTLAEVPE